MAPPERQYFQLAQAREVAAAFERHNVDYLFIGKGGAIILGYPAATQDVDLFPKKNKENGRRIVAALNDLGFLVDELTATKIIDGVDFVQINSGPFDLDLVFAPDGIESFEIAEGRKHLIDGFPVANIRDIIASKRASGRAKDLVDLPLLEEFREEFEKLNRPEPRTAVDIALERSKTNQSE